jgi:RHS repeat-associated protein
MMNGSSKNYATGMSYTPHGAVSGLTLGNGLAESTLFNSRLQPTQIKVPAGNLLTLQFAYGGTNNNGNVLSQTISAPGLPAALTQTYTYDGVNRLETITETGGATNWNRAYYYDRYGNRAAQGQNVFVNTPKCALPTDPNCSASDFNAANNRLTAPWASYDPAGNLSAFNKLGFEWSAGYDANNLQRFYCAGTTAACTAANATAQYQYDGDGRRVKKLQGSRTTVFVYDAFGNLAAEYDTQPDPNLAAGTYYRTTDHVGSTRLVTDASGAVESRRDFFPFGDEIPANATFGNRQLVTDGGSVTTYNKEFGVHQKFTGKERDNESGLDYFGAGYFVSAMGRFSSPDIPFADQNPALRKHVVEPPFSGDFSPGAFRGRPLSGGANNCSTSILAGRSASSPDPRIRAVAPWAAAAQSAGGGAAVGRGRDPSGTPRPASRRP